MSMFAKTTVWWIWYNDQKRTKHLTLSWLRCLYDKLKPQYTIPHLHCFFQLPYGCQKRPVVYWYCKLTKPQQNYHTTEKELLSIFMVLKEFPSMLLGAEKEVAIHSHNSGIVMCCQFHWERMLILSSSVLPLKALTSAMNMICLSASLIYPFQMLQRTIILTSCGYKHNKA